MKIDKKHIVWFLQEIRILSTLLVTKMTIIICDVINFETNLIFIIKPFFYIIN